MFLMISIHRPEQKYCSTISKLTPLWETTRWETPRRRCRRCRRHCRRRAAVIVFNIVMIIIINNTSLAQFGSKQFPSLIEAGL